MSLYPNTLFVGKVCICPGAVPSTQTYLKTLYAKSKPIEGTAILSYDQTDGYGQRNAPWIAEKGSNVALSIILYPNILSYINAFYLSMSVALSVKKAVEQITDKTAFIKWPNDLMLDDRKVSGILIETSLQNSGIEKAFCGIGLNVNQKDFPGLEEVATSLSVSNGKIYDLDKVSMTLMEWIEKYYLQLKAGKYKEILTEYNDSLHQLNNIITLKRRDDTYFNAKLLGVSEEGKLELELDDKTITSFLHGEVQITYK